VYYLDERILDRRSVFYGQEICGLFTKEIILCTQYGVHLIVKKFTSNSIAVLGIEW
jgi:hypothetical protein